MNHLGEKHGKRALQRIGPERLQRCQGASLAERMDLAPRNKVGHHLGEPQRHQQSAAPRCFLSAAGRLEKRHHAPLERVGGQYGVALVVPHSA